MKTIDSPVSVLNEIKASVVNAKPDPVSIGSVHSYGDYVRQGDVYITLIKKPSKASIKDFEKFDGQLAEGNTRGSRHCVNVNNVKAYTKSKIEDAVVQGPVLYCLQDTDILHPDHGTVKLEKDCWYDVTYQVNYINELRKRVQD